MSAGLRSLRRFVLALAMSVERRSAVDLAGALLGAKRLGWRYSGPWLNAVLRGRCRQRKELPRFLHAVYHHPTSEQPFLASMGPGVSR